jgi:hypothetical protein
VKGPNLVDGGQEASLSDEFEDGTEFVLGTHVGAEDRELA